MTRAIRQAVVRIGEHHPSLGIHLERTIRTGTYAGVTRAVRQAITRIAEHHPQLGEHLHRTIRTGTYFAYMPDPRAPAGWLT